MQELMQSVLEASQSRHGFTGTRSLMQLINVVPGERVLDLGCGDGFWASKFMVEGAQVLGIDVDAAALAAAGAKGVATRSMDARYLNFADEFDAAFTNASLHWMKPIQKVVEGTYRALRPGGRFIGEFGGHGNISSIRVALRYAFKESGLSFDDIDPWEFPLTNDFCNQLHETGFEVRHVETFPRCTPLQHGCNEWLDRFMGGILGSLPAQTAAAIRQNTIGILRDIASSGDDHWVADYVRIRFLATK